MTNIFESPSWEDDIQLIGRTERVSGGQDGVANRPLKQLANRTLYLKEKYDDIDLSGKIEAVKTFLGHSHPREKRSSTETTGWSGRAIFRKPCRPAPVRRRPAARGRGDGLTHQMQLCARGWPHPTAPD